MPKKQGFLNCDYVCVAESVDVCIMCLKYNAGCPGSPECCHFASFYGSETSPNKALALAEEAAAKGHATKLVIPKRVHDQLPATLQKAFRSRELTAVEQADLDAEILGKRCSGVIIDRANGAVAATNWDVRVRSDGLKGGRRTNNSRLN